MIFTQACKSEVQDESREEEARTRVLLDLHFISNAMEIEISMYDVGKGECCDLSRLGEMHSG